jgi:glycosyltransferase involved in cell wall biosynthesis
MKIVSQNYSRAGEGEVQSRSESKSITPDAVPEVSVVIPCLNEADTLAICIDKATRAFQSHNIHGEIIVADNGSTDGSQEIALRLGSRLVHVQAKGYGNALMGGISEAKAKFIIMGDGDDSYNFEQIPRFVEKLRQGYDLVQGCRLPSGGGTILPGAMPFLHRWLGNPLFSWLAQKWFQVPIHDIYCGMRGFTKELYDRLDLRCTGMEFATEMIIKSALYRERIAEVPITLHPDGRKSHPPHLKTFRDGWRTLRFFLISSPRWLFLIPGIFLCVFGLLGYIVALPGLNLIGITFDAHTLLVASMSFLLGYQLILFAILTKTFGISEGLLPPDPRLDIFFNLATLEKGIILGGICVLCGLALIFGALTEWRHLHFGLLDYAHTMRLVIPGVTLTTFGFQNIFSSFMVSIIGIRRK